MCVPNGQETKEHLLDEAKIDQSSKKAINNVVPIVFTRIIHLDAELFREFIPANLKKKSVRRQSQTCLRLE